MNISIKNFSSLILMVIIISCCIMVVSAETVKSDPSGTSIGSINDIPAEDPGNPTIKEIGNQVGKNKIGINYVWVLLCGMLIFFFQVGFALMETGFTRSKNALHTMAMNFVVFLVGVIGYYTVGFALQFGGVGGISALGGVNMLNHEVSIPDLGGVFGAKGFFLTTGGAYDVGVFALFFFQMVFMNIACAIPTAGLAERVKFSSVIIASFFVSMIYYPLFGNWMWGGGWLSTLGKNFGLGHGALDFAGSSVVHGMGGMMALASAMVIGPRIGKYRKDGTVSALPGHDIPMAILGTIILFFSWFAFNAGSTLSGTDLRLAIVATNTMISGALGGFVAMMYMWIKYGKPDPSMTCNGALAGLVAITAPCAFVNSISSCIIGAIAGVLVCVSVSFIDNKLKIDDPVGAISVHAVNGIWGILALGLFADGTYGHGLNGVAGGVKGLFYGDGSQLIAQLLNIGVLFVWGFGMSYVFYKILDNVQGIRVSKQDEFSGLDKPEMGIVTYPDFMIGNRD